MELNARAELCLKSTTGYAVVLLLTHATQTTFPTSLPHPNPLLLGEGISLFPLPEEEDEGEGETNRAEIA